MGRPRKPTKILELSGAFNNKPGRREDRGNEPEPTGEIGPPPKHFKRKALKDIWQEIINITPPGVLTNADRIHLEMICYALEAYRRNPSEFLAARHTRLEAMLGKIGLSPADRSKVGIRSKTKKNSFADF